MKNVLFERTVYNTGKSKSGYPTDTTIYVTEEVNGYGIFTKVNSTCTLIAWVTNRNDALINAVEYVQGLQAQKVADK